MEIIFKQLQWNYNSCKKRTTNNHRK